MRTWWRGADGAEDEIAVLRSWVDQLTQDNMRLRLSQQRPSSPGQFVQDLRGLSADLHALPGASDEAADEALHTLAEAHTIRRAVLDVLVHLQVVAAQLERQMVGEMPIAEIDRRVLDRGGTSSGQRSTDRAGSPTGATPNGDSTSRVLAQMEHMLGGDMSDSHHGSATERVIG